MHGPNHLFCAGCKMEDEALAAAAWAGHFFALRFYEDARKWEATARERLGTLIAGSYPGLGVRCVGEEPPTVEDIDHLIEVLKIQREGFVRRADRQAKAAQNLSAYAFGDVEAKAPGEAGA
jgi:hypothetical protein